MKTRYEVEIINALPTFDALGDDSHATPARLNSLQFDGPDENASVQGVG